MRTKSGGGRSLEADREELYAVVRAAVKDALLDVVGTIALLGLGLLFVTTGARGLLEAAGTTGAVVSLALVGLGFAIAAVALDLVPSIRE
ncbi:hypothetical protein CV102_00855 [Natronococcus pandeyae]|uniref:Uncharacterized protein n=1 Tax=Natronococcus pandeyae TaxID=2055836 RepID=A0A8J8TS28_9EURY|nr:hypothetical protein [Natronococcus pandeyae]TYL40163.1 hypothetical protein CV102_00855 [Natronococcus pandeyae]